MTYLLDTDIFTLAHHNQHGLRERLDRVTAPDRVALPMNTWVEVMCGRLDMVRKASGSTELLRALEWLHHSMQFLAAFPIIPFDNEAATEYERLRSNKSLKKVDRGDLIAASIALAHQATLVTRNTRHFGAIPWLQVTDWSK